VTQTCCPTLPDSNSDEVERLFPQGCTPEIRIPKLSALCSFGNTPRLMSGAIRQILLQHFADPENIMSASLRSYLQQEGAWTADEHTGLYIETLARWRPELTESRPAVIIKEGDWTNERMGIGDHWGTDERTGAESYASFWHGTHTVFALGGEGAETQVLAAEIAKLLVWFGPVIMDQLELHRFLVTSVSGLHAMQEATENYVVAVSMGYIAQERWELQMEAPRLKRIVFQPDAFLRDL